MKPEYVEEISSGDFKLYIIDDYDLGRFQRTGTYVLPEEDGITLIDTCASPSLRYILAGLNELQIELIQVKNIIVTHIHVDHAGAAGLLMKCCPNAKLFVHPMGKMYMCEPDKLEKSLKKVYGNDIFNNQFYPIIPIHEARIHPVDDGEKLKISKKRELQFFHTPGHADHHISIYDPATKGVFAGDTIGAYFPELDFDLYLPITSPPQFNYTKMIESKEKIKKLNPSKIYFGHYGVSQEVEGIYRQFHYWLEIFIDIGKNVWKTEKDAKKAKNAVSKKIYERIKYDLTENGLSTDHPFYKKLKPDIDFCASGIILYLKNINGFKI
ncbi:MULTISPECIES: MBL fold metallo-hydrolase [Bacillus cereus group]|uniref:MBL fold metallo-hydrolase n=1 Tax=Bacillus cereus group TaxID=86661 RepID=UPI000D864FBB|nr:MBL fold metallo-hydrolase [Bacillus cereus]SPT76290.1 beta-lactamase domain-containing protein [Bacillus cereus]